VPICTNCGEASSERARFCQACGAPLKAPEPHRSRRTVTVVFSDVVGSTALAERLDTEIFTLLMDRYFDRMSGVAERHGGTVAKFIGDAIVIVFGVPRAHEDDALRAVRAATEMREALQALNQELEPRWGVALATKTAVNTGEILASTSDPDDDPVGRGGHIAVGDAMNIGARLEQAAEAGDIVLGEATYELVREAVDVGKMPPLSLKGKAEPVTAYRLAGISTHAEAIARHLDSPMVGRREHLEALLATFERAQHDRTCSLVTVMAPAGVGKSRLVEEFLGSAGGAATELSGHCLSYGEGITFWPLAEMVKDVAGISDRDAEGEALGKIIGLLGGSRDAESVARSVAETIGLAGHTGLPSETFWSIRKLFEGVALQRPLIAVFEDIHWAEQTLLDLIEDIAERATGAPILLVCTTRPDLLETRVDWGRSERFENQTIDLAPLSSEDAERLVRELVDDGELQGSRVRAIVDAAGGNPLFMEQIVLMLVHDGMLHDARDGPLNAEIALPPSIQALIAARLDRLDQDERGSLESASVVGRIFYRDVLKRLGKDPAVLDPTLEALTRRQMIEPSRSDIGGQKAFRFVHALVRDTAYQGIPKGRRADLHEAVANWLEQITGVRGYDEILAYHLEQAALLRMALGSGNNATKTLASRAADLLSAAGDRATARGDAHGAANLLRRATSLLPADDARMPELLLRLSGALGETESLSREWELLEEARERAAALNDRALQARVHVRQVVHHLTADPDASIDEAAQEAEMAIQTFEELHDDAGLAAAWRLRHYVTHMRYRHAESVDALLRARDYDLASGDQSEAIADLAATCAPMLYGPMPVKEAIQRSERILEEVRGSQSNEGFVLGYLGILHAMDGDAEHGRELIARAGAIALDLGMQLTSTATRSYWLAILESLAGDHAAAERELRSGYEVLEDMGETNFASTLAARLAHALCALRRYDEASEFVSISRKTAASGDVVSQVILRGAEGKILASRGGNEEAEYHVREAIGLAAQTDALNMQGDILVDLSEIQRAVHDDRASQSVSGALDLYEQKGNIASATMCRGLLRANA
jgi:predicted ATPase/class 3 adenylate cyclase